jgi:hypothetical protein
MFRKGILAIFTLLTFLGANDVRAYLNWDIYSDAVIKEGDIYNVVRVYDIPPDHTTVNMVGGFVDAMTTYDYSTLNVTAGQVSSLGAIDHSTVNISGNAEIWNAGANEWGNVNISGGNLTGAGATGHGVLNISGDATIWYVGFSQSGTMNMSGGQIDAVSVYDSAVVNLLGGLIVEGIGTRLGHFEGLINVYGYHLGKTCAGGVCSVYGFFPNGSAFSINVAEAVYPRVNLIPEPATLVLLGLGGLIVNRRKE